MQMIFEVVKNVVVYLILITVVMNVLGKSGYKKYIGIFTGMILIIIVVSPMLNVLSLNENLDYYLDINRFMVDRKELNAELAMADQENKEAIILQYKDTLKQQVEELLKDMDLLLLEFNVEIEEEQEKEDYGSIREISMVVEHGIEKNEKKSEIEKVIIEKIIIEDKKVKKNNKSKKKESVLQTMVKQEVANLYEVEQNQVYVEIRELE